MDGMVSVMLSCARQSCGVGMILNVLRALVRIVLCP